MEAEINMRITKKQGGIIGGAVAVVLIAAAIGVHAHYQNRWYPGSTFNKVDVRNDIRRISEESKEIH